MSRSAVQRSELAGWAGYGYCASHSRFFWELRLYLVRRGRAAGPAGPGRPAGSGTAGPLRQANAQEGPPADRVSQPHPQGQLDLQDHGGHSHGSVATRFAQRILAMTPAIWRNHQTGAPITRSLTVHDH
jgi:hypothetical protein